MKRVIANKRTASALLGALFLTTTLAGCASENRLFSNSNADKGTLRRARGEYSVVDATAAQDWDAAARASGFGTTSDAADSQSISVSNSKPVSSSESTAGRGERIAVRKPVDAAANVERAQSRPSADELPELPPPPKRFSERVKDFFSWSKNETAPQEIDSDVSDSPSPVRAGGVSDSSNVSANSASLKEPSKTAKTSSWGTFGKTTNRSATDDSGATSGENSVANASSGFRFSQPAQSAPNLTLKSENRSEAASVKYGEIRKPVASGQGWANGWNRFVDGATKSRRAPTRSVDSVLQYDESRFLPPTATFLKYVAPLEPVAPSGFASSGLTSPASSNTTSNVAPKKTGRELVYGATENSKSAPNSNSSLKNQTSAANVEAESFARSGVASPAGNRLLKIKKNERKYARTLEPRGESAFGWSDSAAKLVFAVPIVARSTVRKAEPIENSAAISAGDDGSTGVSSDDAKIANFFANAPETSPTPSATNSNSLSNLTEKTFSDSTGKSAPQELASQNVATQEVATDDFASQLGEKSFDWFDSAASASAPAPVSNESADASDSSFAENASASSTVDRDARLAKIPETVATDSETSARDPLETAPFDANKSPNAPPTISESFPNWSGAELVDDGFSNASNSEVDDSVSSTSPVSPQEDEGRDESASALDRIEPIERLEPTPSLVEETPGETVAVDAAPSPEASDVLESVPSSVDERKTASDAKPPTDEEIAWIEQIKSAIRSLLQQRDAKKTRGEDVRAVDARLRLLYLAVGEYERAIREIRDENDPLKVFWEKECRGLETLLQDRVEEIDPTLVAERLRSGLDSLSGLCDLRIRKAVLAVAPACFGLFEERTTPYFPGETLYAYSELDFVASAETENGFEIAVECRWRLLDANGNERTPFETQRCANISETKLRDVVLNVAVPLPNDLEPGVYALEMEIVDRNAENSKPATRRLLATVVRRETETTVSDGSNKLKTTR